MKAVLFVIFLFLAQLSEAYPVEEHDGHGRMRVVNYDNREWFCVIVFIDGDERSRYLYPGEASPWRWKDEVLEWWCK